MDNDRELLEAAARAVKPLLNPIGEVFGRLTVVAEIARVNPRKRQFRCRCSCGVEVELNLNKLRSGHTRSCGCLHTETIIKNLEKCPRNGAPKHGMNKSPEHRAWVHMKQRCSNKNKREWPHYGGRGIKVCEEWASSFLAFYDHVGQRPTEKHSLDRIDVNGNYEPGNVRWATQQEQVENTRVVRMININGKTQSLSAWAREMGLPRGQISGRLNAGWSMEEAILTPSIPGQKLHSRVPRDYSERTRDSNGRYLAEEHAAAEIGKAMLPKDEAK